MRGIFFTLVFVILHKIGWGFVPPLSVVLKTCFDGRKPSPSVTVLKHEIFLRSGETIVVEEQLAEIGGKIYFTFLNPNLGEAGGLWSKGTYTFLGDKKIVSKSKAFVSFFTLSKPESFREILIEERFVKRDQFTQYKNSWIPQGDPATWDIAANYMDQPEVFFTKIPGGVGVTAVGLEEGRSKRMVSFDKESLQLARLEWIENKQSISWNFQNYKKRGGDGLFPNSVFMSIDNKQVVKSSLVNRELLKGNAKNLWLAKFSSSAKSAPSSVLEEALRVLLEYR